MNRLFASILVAASLAIPTLVSAQQTPTPSPLPPVNGVPPIGNIQPVGPQVCNALGCYQRFCLGDLCVNVRISGPVIRDDVQQQ